MLRRLYASCMMDAVTGWKIRKLPIGRERTPGQHYRRQRFQADGVLGYGGMSTRSVAAEHALSTQGEVALRSCATAGARSTFYLVSRRTQPRHYLKTEMNLLRTLAHDDGGLGENVTPRQISHLVGLQSNHSR